MSTDPHPHPVRATSPKPGPDKRGPDFVQDRPSPEADLPGHCPHLARHSVTYMPRSLTAQAATVLALAISAACGSTHFGDAGPQSPSEPGGRSLAPSVSTVRPPTRMTGAPASSDSGLPAVLLGHGLQPIQAQSRTTSHQAPSNQSRRPRCGEIAARWVGKMLGMLMLMLLVMILLKWPWDGRGAMRSSPSYER